MTEVVPVGVMAQSLRRLSLLASVLAAFAFAIVLLMLVPLRVAECGPPDPYLLRYLGSPFFYSTGYGAASSLEAQIWAGPLLANLTVIATLIFVLTALVRGRTARVPGRALLWGVVVLSAVLIIGASWSIVEAHNILWTLASPEITAPACDIRLDPFTDTNAWVRTPAP